MSEPLIGWRVCLGKPRKNGAWLVKSLYQSPEFPCLTAVGLTIPKARIHVGTSRQFVIDYYTGVGKVEDGWIEVILKLDCTGKVDKKEDEEKWTWDCPTEVVVRTPIVLEICQVY